MERAREAISVMDGIHSAGPSTQFRNDESDERYVQIVRNVRKVATMKSSQTEEGETAGLTASDVNKCKTWLDCAQLWLDLRSENTEIREQARDQFGLGRERTREVVRAVLGILDMENAEREFLLRTAAITDGFVDRLETAMRHYAQRLADTAVLIGRCKRRQKTTDLELADARLIARIQSPHGLDRMREVGEAMTKRPNETRNVVLSLPPVNRMDVIARLLYFNHGDWRTLDEIVDALPRDRVLQRSYCADYTEKFLLRLRKYLFRFVFMLAKDIARRERIEELTETIFEGTEYDLDAYDFPMIARSTVRYAEGDGIICGMFGL